MPIFDRLKKIFQTEEKPKKKARKETKKEKASKVSASKPRVPRKGGRIVYHIVGAPHITEKASLLASQNKYVFKVSKRSNKTEIKKAIQDLYGVRVNGVNIVNIPRKKRKLRMIEGYKKGYKKAIVSVHEGDKIETAVR